MHERPASGARVPLAHSLNMMTTDEDSGKNGGPAPPIPDGHQGHGLTFGWFRGLLPAPHRLDESDDGKFWVDSVTHATAPWRT